MLIGGIIYLRWIVDYLLFQMANMKSLAAQQLMPDVNRTSGHQICGTDTQDKDIEQEQRQNEDDSVLAVLRRAYR